jgi:nicotinamide-nucleotide amidase
MTPNINAEVISIGTEILLGELTDTNSVFIAQQLRNLGINLYFMTSVGDNRARIADAIRIALSRAHVVITCGGLGPTVDDMTRQAVADATERGLIFHPLLLEQIADRFKRFNVVMSENNRRQAFLPEHATLIENPVGTAPSFIVEHHGRIIISLPGVPREMKYLMMESVVPYLRNKYSVGIIKARTLKTAGIGESMLDAAIGDELLEMSNPTIGLAAHNGQVDVRITAKADTVEIADTMIAEMEKKLYPLIGRHVYGYDNDALEDIVSQTLNQYHLRAVLCEIGITTGISELIPAEVETNRFSYPDEAPLRDITIGTSNQLQRDTGAEVCIVVVSLPDVDERADIQEATAVTVRVGDRTRTRTYGFGAKSKLAREWVTTWALATIWWMVKEHVNAP